MDTITAPQQAQTRDGILQAIRGPGYCFVPAHAMRELLAEASASPTDWERFHASWNDMPRDPYMADGGRYRFRRYATLSAAAGSTRPRLEPHQPHYQSLAYNRLNGGVPRYFDPIAVDVIGGATMRGVLGLTCDWVSMLQPGAGWHIEVHQFRIVAREGVAGNPTPEGMHRDGVDYVLVMMVDRVNIASGTTSIHAPDGRLLSSFTLTESFDSAFLDDARCLHGVTPVERLDPAKRAWRDVLVVTFTRRDRLAER